MFVVGNHDDGNLFYRNSTYNDKPSVSNVLYPDEQFNRITKYGENNGYTHNYYFSDISGIRVIVLYQRDVDYSTAVPQIEEFAIGADQLSWLENTALDTSLPVLVLTHAPLISSLFATGGTGFSDVLSKLVAFKNGGGDVIAVLSGHTHEQASEKVDGINHVVFKNGYAFFEKVSIDLVNKAITCDAINNNNLTSLSLTY